MSEPYPTVWVEDRFWRTCKPRKCRYPKCRGRAVAEVRRKDKRHGCLWWAYCAAHLYGRRIEGGRVLCEVSADSPAAERGYIG